MNKIEKEFSPDFQKDIAELLEICVDNKTNEISMELNYDNYKVQVDMSFRIFKDDKEILG